MAGEKFIWCRSCSEAHHVTPYDQAPLYDGDLRQEQWVPVDDWRIFMRRHTGHRLEALGGADQASWQGGSLDPMQPRFIEVTNGKDYFVVRGFRTSIHEPLCFEVVPGRLSAKRVAVEVQEGAIRKELKKHFSWRVPAPSDEKIELFIGLFRQLVGGLAPDAIKVSRSHYREAGVGYGALSDEIVENLLQECVRYFVPEQLRDLRRFLEAQQDSDGVMALRVKHEYAIEKSMEISSGPGGSN